MLDQLHQWTTLPSPLTRFHRHMLKPVILHVPLVKGRRRGRGTGRSDPAQGARPSVPSDGVEPPHPGLHSGALPIKLKGHCDHQQDIASIYAHPRRICIFDPMHGPCGTLTLARLASLTRCMGDCVERTGFEPVTPGLPNRCSDRTELHPQMETAGLEPAPRTQVVPALTGLSYISMSRGDRT